MSNQLEWSIYFLKIAKEVANNSKCMSRQIGTVIVKDKAIISTGYNGPSRGTKHCNERKFGFYEKLVGENYLLNSVNKEEYPTTCPRRAFGYKSGKGLHLCQAGHSERNALIQAARNGISTLGSTLYCYCGRPCKDCMIEIVNAGISTVVCLKEEVEYDEYSKVIAEEAGLLIIQIEKSLIK